MFFRVSAPTHLRNPGRVQMMKDNGWKRVATIHQSVDNFSKVSLYKTLLDHVHYSMGVSVWMILCSCQS